MFEPYSGDLMGLYVDENYIVFKWLGAGLILVSVSQRGNAVCAHFACDRAGVKRIKKAISDFTVFAFETFGWCRMILAQVTRPSVERLVKRCGFIYVGEDAKGVKVYARYQ